MKNRIVYFLGVGFLIMLFMRYAFSSMSVREQTPTTANRPLLSQPIQSLVFVGDTGSGLPAQYQVANMMQGYCKTHPCKGIYIMGDVIYENGVTTAHDAQFMEKFEKPYAALDMPFWIILGNHDYLGCIDCYLAYSKQSHKWHLPARYYVQTYGDVLVVVIDTEQWDTTQSQWLRNTLLTSTNRFKVVTGHRPLKSFEESKIYEIWTGQDEVRDIVCAHADYYLAGHAHIFEDVGTLPQCKTHLLTAGTGGASLRGFKPRNTNLHTTSSYGFIVLEQAQDHLTYRFVSENAIYSPALSP